MKYTYNTGNNCIEEDGRFLAYVNSTNAYCIVNKLNELSNDNKVMAEYVQDIFETAKENGVVSKHEIERILYG